MLEEARQDVLLLYDCCHSSHPTVNTAGREVTEVIAACGFETQVPAVGPHSFTNALIKELEESFYGQPFYTAELHTKILGSLKNWQPDFLKDSRGNIWRDENGHPRRECQKRRTPVHCLLTTERPGRSIMLAPLSSRLFQEAIPELELVEPPLPRNQDQAHTILTKTVLRTPYSSPTLGSNSSKVHQYPEILISVRLEEDYFDGDNRDDERGSSLGLNGSEICPEPLRGSQFKLSTKAFRQC